MNNEMIDRRAAIGGMMGCLMGPFIPKIREPTEPPKPAQKSFYVTHYDPDHGYNASLSRDGMSKAYRMGSVAEYVLTRLYDDGECEEVADNEGDYGMLDFIWNRHDHERI